MSLNIDNYELDISKGIVKIIYKDKSISMPMYIFESMIKYYDNKTNL